MSKSEKLSAPPFFRGILIDNNTLAIPIIATYVDHTNIKDIKRYIHLPKFDCSNITTAGAPFVDACVPETFDV